MSATVVWSPNLRLAVKELKAIPSRKVLHKQTLTTAEEQALSVQFSQSTEDLSRTPNWW